MKILFSFLLFLSSYVVSAQCDPISGVTATSITATSALITGTTPSVSLYFVIVYTDGVTTYRQNINDPGAPYPHLFSGPLNSLTPETEYDYYVVRYCSVDDSSSTATQSFTTLEGQCDSVSNAVVTTTSSTATVASSEAAYGTSYIIKYVKQGYTDTASKTGATADFSLTGLKSGSTYYYYIRTYCGTDSAQNTVKTFLTKNSPNYTPQTGYGAQFERTVSRKMAGYPAVNGEPSVIVDGKNDYPSMIQDTTNAEVYHFNPKTQTYFKTSIDVVDDITALKAHKLTPRRIFVKDSLRGGNFTLTYLPGQTADAGVYYAADSIGADYFWVREETQADKVNVLWFGADNTGATNTTAAFDAARDFLKDNRRGGEIFVPAGTYQVSKIVLKAWVSLVGAGNSSTFIIPDTVVNDGKPCGLIEMDAGAVVNVRVEKIALYGNQGKNSTDTALNPNQWGIYLRAQYDEANVQGGIWYSTFKNLVVASFNNGVWSRGQYKTGGGTLPNQHDLYEKLNITVQAGGTAMRFTGQHGQIYVNGGIAKGINATKKALYAVELTCDPDPSQIAKQGVHGEDTLDVACIGSATRTPSNVTFANGFGPQNSNIAFRINRSDNIRIMNCWFENNGGAFAVEGDANISVDGNRLANSSDSTNFTDTLNSGPGFIIKQVNAGGHVDYGQGNYIAGIFNKFLIMEGTAKLNNYPGVTYIGSSNRVMTDADYFPEENPYQITLDSSGNIDIGANKYVLLNPNAVKTTELDTITAFAMPGDVIVLKATNGNFTITTGGNISASAGVLTKMTVRQGATVSLVRTIGVSTKWALVSMPLNYGASEPADGEYYAKNTRIYNNALTVSQALGWVCTTAGIAGTDAVFAPMNGSLNDLEGLRQTLERGTSGTDFNIVSASNTHTLNIPYASIAKNGLIDTIAQSFKGIKTHIDLVKYADNYGSLYDARTLVDKNYVDSSITALGGGVTSVSGTADRVTSTGGTTPVIDISSTFEGLLLKKADNLTGLGNTATSRSNLGATTVGSNLFTLTNPSAITFPRFNADNTVDALSASDFRTAIGAGTGGGDALVANPLSQFASTTSAQLLGVMADETGSGSLVFGTSPTFVTPTLGAAVSTSVSVSGQLNNSTATTARGYRLTNGGSTTTPDVFFGSPAVVTAGTFGIAYDIGNQLAFTHANGTRHIASGLIQLTSLDNTAGSEDGDLSFFTQSAGAAASEKLRITNLGSISLAGTITAGGTTGDQTINKAAGTVNIATGNSSITVTNSLCTANSLVFAVVRTNDAAAIIKNVVPGAGSFVITLNAATGAETSIAFWVVNVF